MRLEVKQKIEQKLMNHIKGLLLCAQCIINFYEFNFCHSTNENKNVPIYTDEFKWVEFLLPLTTQCQLCVCGDTSWWRGQALKLGHSYTSAPCTNTDEAQQFSTSWGYGSGAGVSVSSSVEVTNCWQIIQGKVQNLVQCNIVNGF